MKVAINTLVVTPTGGGGKTFLTNLVRNIAKIDKNTAYYLIVSRFNEGLFERVGENCKLISIPAPFKNRLYMAFIQQLLIPYYIARHKIDALVSYGNIATLFPGCKQVLIADGAQTIRGARRRHAPDTISKSRAFYFDVMLPLSLKRATQVVTVSDYMKKELVKAGRIPEQKVTVIYEGIDINHTSVKESAVEGFNLPRPYLLFVSDIYKHKNADKILKAFHILKRNYEIPHKLVVVGRDMVNMLESLLQQADELGVAGDTIFTGPVPHKEIAGIYRNADAFVFPSAFESFGLPVLEAMACGVPVIASNSTAVPEIVGDAGLSVDPNDAGALADAIYSVITDRTLRESLIKKGYERASTFTWESAARGMSKVLEDVFES